MKGIIVPVCQVAIYDQSDNFTRVYFIKAVEKSTDWIEGNNPLTQNIKIIEALQQDSEYTWNPAAKKFDQRVVVVVVVVVLLCCCVVDVCDVGLM